MRTLVKPDFGHHPRVFFPKSFWRLVRIVVDTQQELCSGELPARFGRPAPRPEAEDLRRQSAQPCHQENHAGYERSSNTCFLRNVNVLMPNAHILDSTTGMSRMLRLCGPGSGARATHYTGLTMIHMPIPPEIKGQKYIDLLATFRKNGTLVHTPVWFGEKDEKLYVVTRNDSGKYKRIKNNSQVRRRAMHDSWKHHGARICGNRPDTPSGSLALGPQNNRGKILAGARSQFLLGKERLPGNRSLG